MWRELPSGQETPEQDGVGLRALSTSSNHHTPPPRNSALLLLLLAFGISCAHVKPAREKEGRAMASLVNSVCRLFVPVALLLSEYLFDLFKESYPSVQNAPVGAALRLFA